MTPRRLLVCPASKSASRHRRKQQRRCCSLFCVLFCSLTCLVFAGCVAARHPSKHHNRGAHLLLQGISAKEIGGFHLQERKQPSRGTSRRGRPASVTCCSPDSAVKRSSTFCLAHGMHTRPRWPLQFGTAWCTGTGMTSTSLPGAAQVHSTHAACPRASASFANGRRNDIT